MTEQRELILYLPAHPGVKLADRIIRVLKALTLLKILILSLPIICLGQLNPHAAELPDWIRSKPDLILAQNSDAVQKVADFTFQALQADLDERAPEFPQDQFIRTSRLAINLAWIIDGKIIAEATCRQAGLLGNIRLASARLNHNLAIATRQSQLSIPLDLKKLREIATLMITFLPAAKAEVTDEDIPLSVPVVIADKLSVIPENIYNLATERCDGLVLSWQGQESLASPATIVFNRWDWGAALEYLAGDFVSKEQSNQSALLSLLTQPDFATGELAAKVQIVRGAVWVVNRDQQVYQLEAMTLPPPRFTAPVLKHNLTRAASWLEHNTGQVPANMWNGEMVAVITLALTQTTAKNPKNIEIAGQLIENYFELYYRDHPRQEQGYVRESGNENTLLNSAWLLIALVSRIDAETQKDSQYATHITDKMRRLANFIVSQRVPGRGFNPHYPPVGTSEKESSPVANAVAIYALTLYGSKFNNSEFEQVAAGAFSDSRQLVVRMQNNIEILTWWGLAALQLYRYSRHQQAAQDALNWAELLSNLQVSEPSNADYLLGSFVSKRRSRIVSDTALAVQFLCQAADEAWHFRDNRQEAFWLAALQGGRFLQRWQIGVESVALNLLPDNIIVGGLRGDISSEKADSQASANCLLAWQQLLERWE